MNTSLHTIDPWVEAMRRLSKSALTTIAFLMATMLAGSARGGEETPPKFVWEYATGLYTSFIDPIVDDDGSVWVLGKFSLINENCEEGFGKNMALLNFSSSGELVHEICIGRHSSDNAVAMERTPDLGFIILATTGINDQHDILLDKLDRKSVV